MKPQPPVDAHGSSRERTREIQAMFGRIVPRYDRMNRLMSLGMDASWRRRAVRAAEPAGKHVLDLGTGTGDLAHELARGGAALMCGADLTPAMLSAAAGRHASGVPYDWVAADGHRLPFADESFDVVTNAFVLRNLVDLPVALREMARVLRQGGRAVCLDMTLPPPGIFAAAYRLYFNHIVPPITGLLSGDFAAYRYLPASLSGFPTADALAQLMHDAGFRAVTYSRLAGGAVALHVAAK